MSVREVIVCVTSTRVGKPRISTFHSEADTADVRAAFQDAGRERFVREPADWSDKDRERYIRALKARGFTVVVWDNRRKVSRPTRNQTEGIDGNGT